MTTPDLSQVTETSLPTGLPSEENLPIPAALNALVPNTNWALEGNTYEGLKWYDDPGLKPSKSAVLAKARELVAEFPMRRLRIERDLRLKDVDWVVIRSIRTGEPIPQEWKDYMQALADLPANSNPYLSGRDLLGVTWPERPDGKPAGILRTFKKLA